MTKKEMGAMGRTDLMASEISHPRSGILRFQKRPLLQLLECIAQLFLRVHHDWPVPSDGFLQRLAGKQQKADAVFTAFHCAFVAAIEEDERTIVGVRWRRGVEPVHALRRHGKRAGG